MGERPEVGKPTTTRCHSVAYGRSCGGEIIHWQQTFEGVAYWVTSCRECGMTT